LSVARSEVIGKKVYDIEAKYLGDVYDIGFKLGETSITVFVRTPGGATLEVPWDKISAIRDIVLVKEPVELPEVPAAPAFTAAPPAQQPAGGGLTSKVTSIFGGPKERKICPYCGKPATWIEQYKRWYCYNCQRYID